MVALALFYDSRYRFCAKVNFQEITVFVFAGNRNSIKVWLEGNKRAIFAVTPPASWFCLEGL